MPSITFEGKVHGLGWVRDHYDPRDYYMAARPRVEPLPDRADLRAWMPEVYDQSNIGCHDDRTEVLTERGWERWADYGGGTMLGTVDPVSGRLEFQHPTALHTYEYKGPLHHIDHQSLDFALTPNHRMWVRPWNERARTLSNNFQFTEIDKIGWYAGLMASPAGFAGTNLRRLKIGSREYNGDDFMALVALVLSDGWVGGTANNWNAVSFCCFRDDRYAMIAAFAARMGFSEAPGRRGVWKWSDGALAAWFRENGFIGTRYRSTEKKIPQLVKVASQDQVEHFLNYYGDQHVRANRQFYTSSRRMVDDLQELLLRVGKRGGIYEREARDTVMKDGRVIHARNCANELILTEWQKDRLSIGRKRQIEIELYRGAVYCATVPNGLLVTRRNNQVLVSGNSCTAQAIAAAIEYVRMKDGQPPLHPSRLFIYFNEREMEGTIESDAGAMIRDGIKSVVKIGVCSEERWPYDIKRFRTRPPIDCYQQAMDYQTLEYARVQNTPDQIKGLLADGFPIIFGATLFESFMGEDASKTGNIPVPTPDEQFIGGHAMLIVGYNDEADAYIVRSSWGDAWGNNGNCWFPYDYLHSDYCSDLWVIRKVE